MTTFLGHSESHGVYFLAIGLAVYHQDEWRFVEDIGVDTLSNVQVNFFDSNRDRLMVGTLEAVDDGWKLSTDTDDRLTFGRLTKSLYDRYLKSGVGIDFADTDEIQAFYQKMFRPDE